MEDAQIVELYWQRREEAVMQTQKKYDAYLNAVAFRILADQEDSRECVNDALLAAWESIPPHRPKVLSVYLAKITRQTAIDVYRRRSSAKRRDSEYALSLSELEDVLPGGTTPEEVLEGKLLEESLDRFLAALSREERNLFLRRYYFFDSLAEAAHHCGMGQAKAKSMLHRTRQRLRRQLEKEGFTL